MREGVGRAEGWGWGMGSSQGRKLPCGRCCPPSAHVDLEPAVPAACAPCRAPPTPRCSCLPSWLISGRVGQLQTVRRARSGCELPLTAWVCPVLLPHQGLLGGQVPPLGPAGTIQRRWGQAAGLNSLSFPAKFLFEA